MIRSELRDKYFKETNGKSEYSGMTVDAGYAHWLEEKVLDADAQKATHNIDYAKCKELLEVCNNAEKMNISPAVTLYVIKEKLEQHFA